MSKKPTVLGVILSDQDFQQFNYGNQASAFVVHMFKKQAKANLGFYIPGINKGLFKGNNSSSHAAVSSITHLGLMFS